MWRSILEWHDFASTEQDWHTCQVREWPSLQHRSPHLHWPSATDQCWFASSRQHSSSYYNFYFPGVFFSCCPPPTPPELAAGFPNHQRVDLNLYIVTIQQECNASPTLNSQQAQSAMWPLSYSATYPNIPHLHKPYRYRIVCPFFSNHGQLHPEL